MPGHDLTEEQLDWVGCDDSQDLLAHTSDDVLEDRHRWPKELALLAEHAEAAIVRLGFEQAKASKIANAVLTQLAFAAGGRSFYLPMGMQLKNAMRDREIWKNFNGKNVDELAQHYRLTQMQIYTIIKRQRALAVSKVQPQLF